MQSREQECQQLHVPIREGLCGARQVKSHQCVPVPVPLWQLHTAGGHQRFTPYTSSRRWYKLISILLLGVIPRPRPT